MSSPDDNQPSTSKQPASSTVGESGVLKTTKRQIYSRQQINIMETFYKSRSKFLQRSDRSTLSNQTGLTERQVKIWFQNRRMKEKKEGTGMECTSSTGIEHEAPQTNPMAYHQNPSVTQTLPLRPTPDAPHVVSRHAQNLYSQGLLDQIHGPDGVEAMRQFSENHGVSLGIPTNMPMVQMAMQARQYGDYHSTFPQTTMPYSSYDTSSFGPQN